VTTETFVDDHLLRIGSAEFYCSFPFSDAPPGLLEVMKPRDLVNCYIDLCRELEPRRIFELGIKRGGSTAMISELTRPDKLVAIELATRPVNLLDRYISERSLGDVVRPYYGVNQADHDRLREIVDAEFGAEPIDLVVDDASHFYDETRSSFETLFPHLRPGGLFVIEDWSWQHRFSDGFARTLSKDSTDADRLRAAIETRMLEREQRHEKPPRPLSRLMVELLLVRASAGDFVRELGINRYWVVVQRGDAPLDPESFRLSELYHDHFGMLTPE
jgi:predicted O-methyltransferase YrrM